MKIITTSEFRKNIKKYADLANAEKIIVNRGSGKAFAIVPVDMEEVAYDEAFIKKITETESEENTLVKNPKKIWESIL